jgi:ABC-2 type transport system permease protein
MMKTLRFLWTSILFQFKNSAELRTSFIMSVVGMMINNTSFIIVWMLFAQAVGTFNGWTAYDIIALNGYTSFCFGIVFAFWAGIRQIPQMILSGSFDRFMTRPQSVFMQVATSGLGIAAEGDVLFGIICIGAYWYVVPHTLEQMLMTSVLLIITTIIFAAYATFAFSSAFFFYDGRVVADSLFEFFFTPSLMHGGAFQGWVRVIFTFIVPTLTIGALPVEAVKHVSWWTVVELSLLAALWVYIAKRMFRAGILRYESANLQTFGE